LNTLKVPNFFIVGAPKCGTTAMYEYLKAHPDIFMPEKIKEPHYFAPDLATPASKPYLVRDRYLALFTDAGRYTRVGEASVMYLYSPHAARAIHDFNPAARIIIMLRSPIEMMYAWYYQQVRSGNETMPTFEAALKAEADRCLGHHVPPGANANKLRYRAVACFSPQVSRYFSTFGHEAVHVIIYDDFKAHTAQVYHDTLVFLGVNPDFQPEFQVVNENQLVRFRRLNRFRQHPPSWFMRLRSGIANRVSDDVRDFVNTSVRSAVLNKAPRPTISPELRAQLQEEFLPEIERLSQLLGRDLTHWCRD
jgi:hypothetical protein